MNKRNRLFITLFTSFAVTFIPGAFCPVFADDTDIYLGARDGDAVKHNVLFILDTSISMDQKVDVNGDGDTTDPEDKSRIAILQDAMNNLVSRMDNARVGLMRMNGTDSPTRRSNPRSAALDCNAELTAAGAQDYGNNNRIKPAWQHVCYVPTGGTVLFPIEDLDKDVSTVSGETNSFTVNVPVSSSADDARQPQAPARRNNVRITDATVDLGYSTCPAADIVDAEYRGSSASDDAIQNGATVTTAGPVNFGSVASGFRFDRVFRKVTGTGTTTTATDNSVGPLSIPDNAPILEATITFTANTSSTDDLNVNIAAAKTNKNTFSAVDDITGRAPTTASVDWLGVPVAADPGDKITTPNLSSIIQELVSDAANWNEAGDAVVFLVDNDAGSTGRNIHDQTSATNRPVLKVKYCNDILAAAEQQWIGLRFQKVGIPQGAQIESAFIDFKAANPVSNTTAQPDGTPGDNVRIYGELSPNAATFTAGTQFSNRHDNGTRVTWKGHEMGNWTDGDTYSTPDLKAVVQAIVDQPGWCGQNNMALFIKGNQRRVLHRAISTYDDDPANAPVLRVTYSDTFSGSDTGCNARRYTIPMAQSNHDAHTNANATTMKLNSPGLPLGQPGKNFKTGLIFKLPVVEDTVISSAKLEFTATGNAGSPGNAELVVNAQRGINAPNFTGVDQNLEASERPRISGAGIPVNWSQPPVTDDSTFGVDVTPLVAAVTSQGGWAYDNQMAFIISDGATPLYRQVDSYDGNPSAAPRLILDVQENLATTTRKTVRERLQEINGTLTIPNLLRWTPSIETLYEAARYWRGKGVHFGKTRGAATISGDGIVDNVLVDGKTPEYKSVDYKRTMHRTLTSHPGSMTGGSYVESPTKDPSIASCRFSHDPSCVQDQITGAPTYKSPIDAGLECAGNFQIFLTDGAPTFTNDSTVSLITTEFGDISSCSEDASVNAKGNKGRCAVEMARSLATNDQSALHDKVQTVTTYTIAFNLNDATGEEWLRQIARAGNGQFFRATNAGSLLTAFNAILNDIVQRPTSFVAPSIAANAFNRLFSRNHVYFGLFEPNTVSKWDGNVKKYNLCTAEDPDGDGTANCKLGDVLDANRAKAVDASGLFVDSGSNKARSVWSASADGRDIKAGGAGGELSAISQRTIYTDLNSSGVTTTAPLSANGYNITSANYTTPDLTHIHSLVCPTPSDIAFVGTGCDNRMRWLLGQDVRDEDSDSNTTELRWWFPDVLHSSPVTVTYGKNDKGTPSTADDEFIDKIVVGTNGGGLHMIDGNTGVEEWVFMPAATLSKQQTLYNNSSADHVYGMDLTPVVRTVDINNDGNINPTTDKVHVYAGMRRGGVNYYALDITPSGTSTPTTSTTITPKLLWRILGGTNDPAQGNYTRLAQTWSEPAIANIQCTGSDCASGSKTVLIFAGGYDEDLDSNFGLSAGAPNDGNALYIVDADTGELIFWISHAVDSVQGVTAASGADIEVPNMFYSIVHKPTIFDSDGDGFEDRIYVGDTAGQVWRIDLADNIQPGGTSPEGGSLVGRLANISTDATAAEQRRFHNRPAVAQVRDSVYSNAARGEYDYVVIPSGDRASPIATTVQDRLYAFRDKTPGPMSGAAGLATGYPAGTTGGTPINESNMIDVTNRTLNSHSGHKASSGWYYSFDTNGATGGNTGQKGLAAPTIIAGTVILTSYKPADPTAATPCSAAEGSGVAHQFNILNAAAALDWDGDGAITPADRSTALGAGIPSGAVPIFTEEGVTVLVGTGGGAENLGKASGLPRYRTYWAEELPSL